MAKSKKPRKPYNPNRSAGKPRLATRPWVVDYVLRPFDYVIRQLETKGAVDYVEGEAVYIDEDRGGWYRLGRTAPSYLDSFDILSRRHSLPLFTQPIRKLIEALDSPGELSDDIFQAAKTALNDLRKAIYKLPSGELRKAVEDSMILYQLEKAGAV